MNVLDFQKKIIDLFASNLDHYRSHISFDDYIYHYTNQYSLSQIVSNKEIWASHALDMNDPNEIFFGIETLTNYLATKLNKNSHILEIIEQEKIKLKDFNRVVEVSPIFIFSFSAKRDDLKQWVHYSNNGDGISIEFIRSKIIENIKMPDLRLPPLLLPVQYYYNPGGALSAGGNYFLEFADIFFSNADNLLKNGNYEIDTRYHALIFEYILYFASLIKHNLYSDEEEWRLVIMTGRGDKKISIKTINNIAKMKYLLSLDETKLTNIIDSIMLGPQNYNNLTVRTALELLMIQQLDGATVLINNSSGKIR